jgi:hypothetical protein
MEIQASCITQYENSVTQHDNSVTEYEKCITQYEACFLTAWNHCSLCWCFFLIFFKYIQNIFNGHTFLLISMPLKIFLAPIFGAHDAQKIN